MVNYGLGKIYKITSSQTDKVYIGSTAQKYLHSHLSTHVKNYKSYKGVGSKYMTSYEILKYGDYKIELVECYPCTCREELHKREGEIMKEYDNRINKRIAGRKYKEYNDDHKEEHKLYYEENKEKISKYKIKHYEENKEHYTKYKSEWYQKNKEKLKLKAKRIHNEKQEIKKLMLIDY